MNFLFTVDTDWLRKTYRLQYLNIITILIITIIWNIPRCG